MLKMLFSKNPRLVVPNVHFSPKIVNYSGDRWNQIFASLTQSYLKLTQLGFTYYNGKVAIIESSEEESNV